jgi:ketosteroid isomerase-like protein
MNRQQVAEAFSRHDFTATYPHIADDVRWINVGGGEYLGKDALVAACDGSAEYLAVATTEFTKFRVVDGGSCVVIDSTATYTGPDGNRSVVASCDLYDFTGDLLTGITSYTVELTGE